MTENIDTGDESLENPKNIESEKLSGEITPSNESDTITPKQEYENMEVHHHAHHDGKKNWKTYFWEFFMLFLAVFCGFLAEYQLEHKIERDREREYIQSMIGDLKNDTLSLGIAIRQNMKQVRGKDNFILLLDKGTWTKAEIATLYNMHWKYVGYTYESLYSKRAINQLMNAGGLRLIHNKLASDNITIYATYCNYVETVQQQSIMNASSKALDYSSSIFNNSFIRFSPDLQLQRLQSGIPALLTTKREVIKSFSFFLEQDKDAIISGTIALKKNKELAEKLLLLLQKEYNIK